MIMNINQVGVRSGLVQFARGKIFSVGVVQKAIRHLIVDALNLKNLKIE